MATEGDIFAKSNIVWPQYRYFPLDTFHGIVMQLERLIILTITMDNLIKVICDVMNVGVKVDRMDYMIHEDRECQLLLQKVNTLGTPIKESTKTGRGELVKNNPSLASMTNYKIKNL